MFPAKCVVATAVVGIFASTSPTKAQSNQSSGSRHGASLYVDFPNALTYRNVEGASNGSGFVIGIAEVGPYQHALAAYSQSSPHTLMREPVEYSTVSVTSNTNEFLASGFVLTQRFSYSVLLRYGADPLNRMLLGRGNDDSSITAESDPDGDYVALFNNSLFSAISWITRDGVTRWSYDAGPVPDIRFGLVAIDRAGNAVVSGLAFRDAVLFQKNIRQGTFLFKVSPSGEISWLRHVMGSGYVTRVKTTRDGTIVFVAHAYAAFAWAGRWLEPTEDAPEFLLTARQDGSDFWARPLDNSSMSFLMSVHQAGQIAVAGGSTGCNGTFVRNFDLAGNFLWERVFDPQSCDGHVRARGLTFSDDDLVIAGDLQGIVDLGWGPLPIPGQEAFYLGLSM